MEEKFWVFVDLGGEQPDYYIAPAWWVENDMNKHHKAYLKRHGGHRAVNDASQHHAIQAKRLTQWRGRWDVLGILSDSEG
ncbi:MAG TPA: hypothetical protein VF165_00130 [Nocardioidaceae bacterium]